MVICFQIVIAHLLVFLYSCSLIVFADDCGLAAAKSKLIEFIRNGDNDLHDTEPEIPTHYKIAVAIRDVAGIDEMQRTVDLLLSVEMTWNDSRLDLDVDLSCTDVQISVPKGLENKVWQPNLHFPNAISVRTVSAPTLNSELRVHPGGRLVFVWMASASFPCATAYAKFPFDRLSCDVGIVQWGSSRLSRLAFDGPSPLSIRPGRLRLSTFDLHLGPPQTEQIEGRGINVLCTVYLRRLYVYHILQIFIPNIMTVLVAWSAFFYPLLEGMRISILMTTLMTAAIQYSAVSGSLPKVGYLKGIDLWMLGCMSLIFFGVMEYAFLNLWNSQLIRQETEAKDLPADKSSTVLNTISKKRRLIVNIDKFIRHGFLVMFAIFVGIYFALFVYGSPDDISVLVNE